MLKTETKTERISEIINNFNQSEEPDISDVAKFRLEQSLFTTGILDFGVFACPPINARLLLSSNPEQYILTTPTGTSFEKGGRDQRIYKMFRYLREAGFESQLTIIIGDTDEEDYIFPVTPPAVSLDSNLLEAQKAEFYANFSDDIKNKVQWNIQVERYSEIASLFDDKLPRLDLTDITIVKDLIDEAQQMKESFGPDGYYEGLATPTSDQIQRMTELKFITYAFQGRRLAEMYPNMVLIQNEFPLLLRTRMLNLLNNQLRLPILPAIYPIADRRGKKNG